MKTPPSLFVCACLLVPALGAAPPLAHGLVNGDFSAPGIGKAPSGWTAVYPNSDGSVFSDGKDTFLRLVSRQGNNVGMAQQLDIPPKAKTVLVMGRMRGKPENAKTEPRAAVQVALTYKDAKGGNINAAILASENSPNWHTFRREAKLPLGATKVEVAARAIFAIGAFDFDEVRVEFK